MIKFENINDFLDFLPGNERMLVEQIREIVFECIPNVKEKLSYNVPYFYGKKRICFIWPSSVPWGNVKKNGVLIGFCQGNLIEDDLNYLEKGSRKQVFTKTFFTLDDLDEQMLRNYLMKASAIDEEGVR